MGDGAEAYQQAARRRSYAKPAQRVVRDCLPDAPGVIHFFAEVPFQEQALFLRFVTWIIRGLRCKVVELRDAESDDVAAVMTALLLYA
jgi:hypothetical protein